MPDSIVVYRNPLEKLFWEHPEILCSNILDLFIFLLPIIVGIGVGVFLLFRGLIVLNRKYNRKHRMYKLCLTFTWVIAIMGSLIMWYIMQFFVLQ